MPCTAFAANITALRSAPNAPFANPISPVTSVPKYKSSVRPIWFSSPIFVYLSWRMSNPTNGYDKVRSGGSTSAGSEVTGVGRNVLRS